MNFEETPPLSTKWFAVAAYALAFLAAHQSAFSLPSLDEVDRTEVLVIGPLGVSAYRVAKNFNQFRQIPGQTDRALNPAEVRLWFTQFIDRQVIIAHAIALGYGEREFVRRELSRMERHMLTSRRGPYYEQIFAEHQRLVSDHTPARQQNPRVYQLQIARVPKSAPIVARLSLEEGALPREGSELFVTLRESGEAEVFKGWMREPFAPFNEIGSSLESTKPGELSRTVTPGSLLLYQIIAVGLSSLLGQAPAPADPAVDPGAEFERQVELAHQQEIIARSRWRFDWAGAEKVVALLAQIRPDPSLSFGDEVRDPLQDVGLGDYWEGETRHEVRGADYVEYYNRQFVRRLPRQKLDVYEDIRRFVIELQDYQDAHKDRILLQPKFSEDRENYRNNLILEAFEKERFGQTARNALTLAEWRSQIARQLQSSASLAVVDHIPYEKFGLQKDGTAAPP